MPADAPIEQYWSVTAYDRETHALILGMSRPSLASNDTAVQKNADGSTDVYFGPKAPAGKRPTGYRPIRSGSSNCCSASMARRRNCSSKEWKLPDAERVN